MNVAGPAPLRTIVDVLEATVDAAGDREAFVDGDRRITFAGWRRAAGGVAAALREAGVRRGDMVCLRMASSLDYAVCYLATVRLGAVASGINPRLGPSEVSAILARAGPRVTVRDDSRRSLDGGGRILDVGDLSASFDRDPPRGLPRLRPDEPVAVVWTSGTTGLPKGAVFDHGNLAAVARGSGDLSAPGDRRLSPLPFAHVGYMTKLWDELANAITTVIVPSPWKASEALRLIEEEAVTVAQGVPSQWSLMLAHPDAERRDLSSLRVAGTGGSSVAPALVRQIRDRLCCPVVVGYASTEAAIITRSQVGDTDEDVATTVGQASDGVELMVVDDAGRAVETGAVGTVRCRSRAAMRRYLGDPELTASVLDGDGWLTTGDLGRLDGRGYLSLVGRRSDMYLRGGYNVYPAEVEGVLSSHPSVSQAAVVGVPDEVLGEVGAAFVVPEGGRATSTEELREWCRARLADYKAPDVVHVVEALPLTAMSKVDKRALAARPFGSPGARPSASR